MTRVPLLPRPVSWLSAVLLYVFLGLWMTFVATVLPRLGELYEASQRLAILGGLAVWVSPIPFVAIGHHFVHAFLDRADRSPTPGTPVTPGPSAGNTRRGLLPGLGSLWAGVFAWLVIMFASSVGVLFMLVLFPPPPPDSLVAELLHGILTSFTWPFDSRARAGIHTVTWVVVAAQLYDLERAMKAHAARGEI